MKYDRNGGLGMLYITEEKENINNLKTKEGFEGSVSEYIKLLTERNSHLNLSNTSSSYEFPPYTPVILVKEPYCPAWEAISEIKFFSLKERQTLREMQEAGSDMIVQIVMMDVMEDLRKYSASFRQFYDDPLISTPWNIFNHSLTNASIPDILGELSIYGVQRLSSGRMLEFDLLYENLMKRDDLNRRLLILKRQSGSKAVLARQNLEKQIKELTSQIKIQLNEKINSKMPKYLSGYAQTEIRKMRMNSYSKKLVKKEQFVATRLDFLNRSGAASLKKIISKLKIIGNKAGKYSTYLGGAAVAYDVQKAYQEGKSTGRAFLTGTAAIGTSAVITSAVSYSAMGTSVVEGALLIGGLSGEAAVATGVLLSTPAGIVFVTVVGVGAVGYAGYKAGEFVGEVWDEYGDKVTEKVSSVAHLIYDEITSGWNAGSQWVLDLYGL